MSKSLSIIEAENRLRQLKESVSRKECWSCDCLQGLLTQLELDCPELAESAKPLKVPAEEMHGCMGCDPCPPGELFAQYLRCQNESACSPKETGKDSNNDDPHGIVRQQYGKIARQGGPCCGPSFSCCGGASAETVAAAIGYNADELAGLPDGANIGLSCGNPTAIASLRPGEVVLDLGAGGGFDVFIAARKVGASGRAIGVDMTPEMIAKARENARKGKFANVEFHLGEIEHLPVADNTADVILSNCVINLSPDKAQVYREAFRVLKPGGRLAISDVVAIGRIPNAIKRDFEKHSGCVAGAAAVGELERILRDAGFRDIRVIPKEESEAFIKDWFPGSGIENYVVSADIQAEKPTENATAERAR